MKKFDFRTGVIGVGSMGQNHARVLSEISNLIGVSDLDVKQGNEVASRFGSSYFNNYIDLLKLVDAVVIAVPTFLHKKVAMDAINLGVHLLIEKPLAPSIEDSELIVSQAENANVKLAVGHIERHNPVINYTKSKLESNKWGDIYTINSKRLSPYPARITDVGVVLDLASHDVDLMRYLSNSDFSFVKASGSNHKASGLEDNVCMLAGFKNGITSLSEFSWLTPMKSRELLISSSNYYVELDFIDQDVNILSTEFSDLDSSNLSSTGTDIYKHEAKLVRSEPLKNELLDFLQSIKSDKSPLVTGYDGMKAVELLLAILDSIKLEKTIYFD